MLHIHQQRAMQKPPTAPSWTRHLVYRAERAKTTWKLRFGVLSILITGLWLTSGWWTVAIGQSLVCGASLAPSDAILVENFDPDYLLFERASELRRNGLALRVLVPVRADPATLEPNAVALGTAQLMAGIAHIGEIEIIPVYEAEPITLNVARDVQRFLAREHLRSVIVVTPLFRSYRSALVNTVTLGEAGIRVRCDPVAGTRSVSTWTRDWHGIQDVVQQWLKLQYYRLYVLPFRPHPDENSAKGSS